MSVAPKLVPSEGLLQVPSIMAKTDNSTPALPSLRHAAQPLKESPVRDATHLSPPLGCFPTHPRPAAGTL